MRNYYAIIPAAGSGQRFGGEKKQFAKLGDKTLLERVVETFIQTGFFKKIIVVLPPSPLPVLSEVEGTGGGEGGIIYIKGGQTRAESVKKGFDYLSPADDDIVLIHDAARPLVSRRLIETIIEDTRKKGAVVPVIPISDTLKKTREGQIVETIDRKNIVGVQTPQGFLYGKLKNAYTKVALSEEITDEARLLELAGETVFTTEGEKTNIKITTPDDLRMAEALCG